MFFKKKLSVFVFAMMNVAIVMNLRGLPMIAKTSSNMLFYILFAAIIFLIPVALVSAELATGWIKKGGIYFWVKEAFGNKLGFVAIWLQWIQNTVWYSTVLAFIAGALSYLFVSPRLAENNIFIISTILIIYWGATFINFKGLKLASSFTSLCVVFGTIIPGIFIIILGLIWILQGNSLNLKPDIIPDFSNLNNIAFLAGTVLLFAVIEVDAVHVMNLDHPKKNYPKALLIASITIASIFLLGSFSLAAVIPQDQISLTYGIMQGFNYLLEYHNLGFLLPVIGFFVAFGGLGSVTAWIAGPSKGLLATAKHGDLPPFLQYTNKKGVQTHILYLQGAIVTILSFSYVLIPDISSAFFLLTALTVVLYLTMYMLLFTAAIKLRYKRPNIERPYKIPGKNWGMWLVSIIGLLGVIFAFIVGFFPPDELNIESKKTYISFIVIGEIVFVSVPFLIQFLKKPSWKQKDNS